MRAKYVTDEVGKKVSVILSIRDFNKMVEDLEELEDIKAYDRAKTRKSSPIPIDVALKEIARLRNGRL